MEKLTVSVELKATNEEGVVTLQNTLIQGAMKLSDTLKLEIALTDVMKAIAVEELAKAEADEAAGA